MFVKYYYKLTYSFGCVLISEFDDIAIVSILCLSFTSTYSAMLL